MFEAHREAIDASIEAIASEVAETANLIAERLRRGGKLVAFGNGGSSAQADHLVAELVGRYRKTRAPLPAISLAASSGVTTCIANDFSYDDVFGRQVEALAEPDDVVVGLSTSGSSTNVLKGLKAGRDRGALGILLTGAGIADAPADYIIKVPSASTARIQEVHLLVIHCWCEAFE
jgi:D-sedoheptulose 7-phosphate isomerase